MEEYKNSLIEYVDKCFKTTIIGAVNACEQKFKDSPEFQAVRKRILDNGNDQRRNVIRLLQKSGITEAQYEYEFKMVPISQFLDNK